MKKMISCLLAVLLLVSLSVSAFATEVVSPEGLTLTAVELDDPTVQGALEAFNAFFDSCDELQAVAGDDGVSVSSAFKASGASFPVSAVLKPDTGAFLALVSVSGDQLSFVSSTVADGEVTVVLPAEGIYLVISKTAIGPSSDGNSYVVKTPTYYVNSAEIKGEPTIVKVSNNTDPEKNAMLIITNYDKKYTLAKTDRVRFADEVKNLTDDFEKFVAEHPEFKDTAPSDALYMSSNKPGDLKLPASITLKLEDGDIFSGILVCENNVWKPVTATIDAAGNITFNVSTLGTYVLLSQAAD